MNQSYEYVQASKTAQVIGRRGAIRDYLQHLQIIPGSGTSGAVTLIDGTVSMPVFSGGDDLEPRVILIMAKSQNGPWKVTTGSNVTVIAVGDFPGNKAG